MASFVIPEVLDNLVGWGPASDAVPEELKYLVRPKFSSTATVLLWLSGASRRVRQPEQQTACCWQATL